MGKLRKVELLQEPAERRSNSKTTSSGASKAPEIVQVKKIQPEQRRTESPSASSTVYSSDGAFFPKRNPYEGITTRRPNPLENVSYSDPLTRAFSQRTGWRDPKSQALYDLAERMQAQKDQGNRKNFAANDPIGQMGRGNIDLYNRPQYRQPDGSLSTVNSISIGTDEGEVLIPTIGRDAKGNPVQWTDDEAIENYFRTGQYLGKFKTPEEADRYAEALHNQQEAYYGADGRQQKITPASVFRSGPLADAVRVPRSRSVEAEYTAPQYKSDPEAGKYIEQSIRSAQNPFVKHISSHIDPADGSVVFDGPTGGRDNWMNEYNVQQNLGSDEFRNSQREINSRIAAGQDYGRTDYEMSVFNNMTADEQKEYSYRLGKYGRNEADKYLQMVGERVSNRKAAEIVEGVNRDIIPEANGVPTSYIDPDTGETVTLGKSPINAAGRVLKRGKLAAQSGLDMFRTGVGDRFTNYVTGRDRITPASPEARASQQVKEGLTGPGRVAYDVVENAAMMLPTTAAAVAASIAMPEAAPAIIQAGAPNSLAAAAAARIAADAPQIFSVGATMFPMSAGQAYEEALQKGLSPNQARLFATAEGLNQAAGEYLLGGFEDISGGYAKQAVDRVLGDVASDATKSATQQTVARAIQHFLTTPEGRMAFSMGSEAFEEIVQGSVSNALGNVAFGENNAPISQEDLYSGLVASLSAGLSNARYYATGYANGAGRVYSAEDIRAAANNIITDRAAYQNQAAYDAAMEQRDQMLRQADYVEQGGRLTPLEKSELADAAGGELGEMDRIGRQVKTGRDMQDISDAIKTAQEIAQTDETRARADEISVRAADIAKRRAEGKQVTDAEVGRLVNDTIRATMAAGNERAAAAAEARSRIGFGEQGASVIESSKASGQKLEAMTAAYEEARYNIPRNDAQKQLASSLLSEREFSAAYQAGIQDRNAFYNNDYSEKIGKIAEKYRPGNMKRGTVTYDGVDIKALETAGDKDSRTKYAQMKTIEHFLSGTLGYNVEWFESKTEDGRYTGENGSYTRSKHLIRLDVNAGADVIGDKVKFASVISHELTHTIEDGSPVQYQKLADSVMKMLVADQEYSQGRNAEQIVADMIENNPYVSNEADAIHELVAQACEDMMNGNADVRAMFEGMSEAEQKTIFDHISRIFAAIKNFFDEMLNSESVRSNRTEAAAIRRAKENIEALQKEWTEGVKQAAAYNAAAYEEVQRQSAEGEQEASESDPVAQFAEENNSNVDSFSIRQLAQATGYDIVVTKKGKIPYAIVDKKTGKRLTKNEITKDVVKNTPMGKLIEAAVQNGTVSEEVADTQRQMFADLFGLIYEYKDAATVWQIASTVMYSGYDDKGARTEAGAVKSNSDPQYGTTIDFGTICAKTQAIIDVMSKTMLEKGRGLTRNEIVEIVYPNVSNAKLSVPCPVCYVFSRWLGVPSLLNTMLTSQERFANATDDEINDYVLGLEKKYGDSKKIGTKKSQISASLTRAQRSASLSMAKIESGKLTEKQLAREQKKLDNALARMKRYDAQVAEIEAYNWVTQVLCETDNSRKAIRDENGRVHRDPDFNKEGSPNRGYVDPDILLDMRRTGEFAELSPKAWLFRTTRGAGMGKAIMPHSGETLGDIVRGSNSGNPIRYSDDKNPFYNAASGDAKTAADGMRDAVDAVKRAIKRAKGQNLIGGLRLQSTSDYRAEWGIDYMMAFFEMQAIGSQGQLYTKVIEAVDFLATTGCEVNLSIMGRGDGYHTDKNGNQVLDFSSVTGIDFDQAYEKTKLYDNVQMILVGLNNTHIRLALADDRIGFVIPWHSSGSSEKTLGALMRGVNEVLGNGTDYSPYQNDIIINEKDKADVRQLRLDILMGEFEDKGENSRKLTDSEKAILNSNEWLKSLYHRFYEDENAKEYGIHLSKDQAEHIFPYEYWDTSLTVDRADENGRRFVEYCGTLGIAPRFSGYFSDKKGQPLKYNSETDFTKDHGYWKLLIDRRMYNRDGTYHEPKAVDVTQLKVNNIETPKRVNSNSYNDTRKINRAVRNTLSDLQRNEEIGNELTISDGVPSSMASNGTQMSARISDASRTGEGNTFLKANDAAKNITAALSENGYRYNYYGIRSTDYKANVGDILPASHDLADDSDGEELSGVSATGFGQLWYDEDDLSEVEKALKSHNKTGYEGEYHYLIGGNESEYGNDPSEVLIKDAEVVGIIDRDGSVITENTGKQMSARDSSGKNLTAQQAEYFKDSKVRDKDGNLMVVYHGTPRGDFTVFDDSKIGTSTDYGWYGRGFYFTDKESSAKYYAGYLGTSRVIKGYLNITNPYNFRIPKGESKHRWMADIMGEIRDTAAEQAEAFTEYLKKEGYDGLIADGQYMIFDSNQFKNVDNENPTANEDIRYSTRNTTPAPAFYSKLQREIEGFKGNKIGAASVESYLKGKGVKDEEIKWSGIRTYLEGKKSVDKAELLQFLKDNEVQIEEKILDNKDVDPNIWSNGYGTVNINHFYDPVQGTEFADEEGFREEAIKRAAEDHLDESEIVFNISDDYMSAETEDGDTILEAYPPDTYELRDADFKPANTNTRWEGYKLYGGTNYREVLFSIPGSDYTNQAMNIHWGRKGVLAHARIQDFETENGDKVLFIEEIQSDWHNAGQKYGYDDFDVSERDAEVRFEGGFYELYVNGKDTHTGFSPKYMESVGISEKNVKKALIDDYRNTMRLQGNERVAPDAPYRTTYTDFVLKNLLRMAAEGDYDYLAWTTADMQSERWSDEFAEGYRIEYDQQIPKFLKKYGKQWGAGLSEVWMYDAEHDQNYAVPAITVNELMKQSVLTEGQPRFSARDNGFGRNASFGTVEELERRNENIREMNYGLDAVLQNRGTQTRKLSDQQIERIARRFLREYGSKADVETITNGLKSMYEYIDNTAKISAQQVGKIANSFAEQILDESKEVDDTMSQMYPELAKDIKSTKLYVSPETMKEMAYYFENAADFRRQAKKLVTISEQRDGARGIDTFYEELSGNFPELFDSEIVNEKDQLLQIMDVAEQLKKKTVNKDWGSEYDEIAYTLGQDMVAAYFAEKGDGSHKRNIDMIKAQMKAEHQEYVDGLRRAKERQIRELKDKLTGERRQNIAKIAELRAKLNAQFRERQDKAELRRLTTQAKARLQKNARNLWSKRGTPEFERLKAKLFSELDLVSVGISRAGVLNLEKTYNDAVRQAALDPDYAASDEYKNIELKFRGGKDIPSIERKKLRDLSYEEIVSLTEDILALKHSQQTYNRLMKDNFKATVAEYGRKGVAQQNIVTGILNQNGFRANALAAVKRYAFYMENPVRAAHLLDGYQEDGVLTELFNDINDGTTKKTWFQQKTHEMFEEVLNDKELMDGWSDQNIEIEVRGQKYHISKGMRIAIALHAQNTDNIRHIENGGFNIPNERYYKRGRYTDAYNSGTRVWMSKEDMDRIAAGMTEGEKRFAQIAHNFFNKTAKDAINETSLVLKGYELAVVPNYFPIRTDKNFTQAEIDGLIHDGTIEGKGQFKDRQPGAKNPILLEDVALVIDRQTQTTGAYYGIAIPVRDMNKVWNYTATAYAASMKDSIARNWGELGKQTIEKTLTDIQAGARRGDTGDHIFSFLKGAYAASTLVGNIGVSIKQAASYPLAISMIDADCLAKGLTMKTDRAYMDSITPWSWDRRHGMGGEEMSDILKQKGMIARNQAAQNMKNFFNWIQKVDVLTTDHLFSACEAQIQKDHPKLEVRGEEYNKKVAELYNEMLWRTQPSYGVMQRNELMRSSSSLMKALTMFKTQTFNMGGEILDAALRAQAMNDYAKNGLVSKAEAKRAAKALGRVMWATVLSQATLAAMTALANAVLRKMRPYRDDKGEVTGASVARKIGTDFVTSWFGLFFGADLAEQGIAAVLNFAQWYDITAPQFDRLNDTVSDLSAWTRALMDWATETDEGKKAERNAKVIKTTAKVAISATGAIGIPAQNIYNMLNAVNLLLQDTSKDGSGFLSFEAGSGLLGLTDTAPTKEQYARQAVYYSERDDAEKVAHALEGTNKSNLEKVLGSKLSKNLYESFLDDPENLAKYMNVKQGGSEPKITDVPDDGYESFTKLREAIGDPERTQNWHHIVEQEQGPGKDNFGNFSSTQINNKNNIVSIPSGAKSPHTAISKYYDSVQDFTDGKTVREWLSTKSFEEQFDFGVKQLQKYGDIIPTSNGWVFVPNDAKIEAALPLETGKPDERTETQKQWATKMAELREDGGLSGREVREAALSMLQNGLTAEEALELYKQNQKSDKAVGKWTGSFEDYLKGRNAVDEAKAIKDSDKKRQSERRKDSIESYLRQYRGSREDELLLWKLMGYSENTFEFK